jgi:thiol-disulfide isomerase/thioredoxin
MYKFITVPLLFLIVINQGISQIKKGYFTIDGKINLQAGEAFLMPIDFHYYPQIDNTYQIKDSIINGYFKFQNALVNPSCFQIGVKVKGELIYLSDFFMVDKGYQTIECNVDSLRKIPKIFNKSNAELGRYLENFNKLKKEKFSLSEDYSKLKHIFNDKIPDSLLQKISKKRVLLINNRNKILYDYTKKHPNSYVAMWELIKKMTEGYSPIYDSIYFQFSDNLKNTFEGRKLGENLKDSKITSIGQTFPRLSLLDTNRVLKKIFKDLVPKYTLIDFWFSRCSPCIQQFPKLKDLYQKYNKEGFDIIAISVDKSNDFNDWKHIIRVQNLIWNQFLDENGYKTEKLSISIFPTNFLLNDKGIIIKKNINTDELTLFLKNSL